MTAAIQANTTFQITPSISCPAEPIGLVEYRLSQLCVSSAFGKSRAARKQRMNRTTNVGVKPQPSGTMSTGPFHTVSVMALALAMAVLLRGAPPAGKQE